MLIDFVNGSLNVITWVKNIIITSEIVFVLQKCESKEFTKIRNIMAAIKFNLWHLLDTFEHVAVMDRPIVINPDQINLTNYRFNTLL